MAKVEYEYDPAALQFKRVKATKLERFVNSFIFLSLTFLIALTLFWGYNVFFEPPGISQLKKENQELMGYYVLLEQKLNELEDVGTVLDSKNDELYIAILETEPLRETTALESENKLYNLFEKDDFAGELIEMTELRLTKLSKDQSVFDRLTKLFISDLKKDVNLASIPSKLPVLISKESQFTSGFGQKIDPFYKVKKLHTGLDFTVQQGSPVFATASGKVKTVKTNKWGAGKIIEIDHGSGLVSSYAHLDEFLVKKGAKVTKGEKIGLAGSTGKSVTAHVHYEVKRNGEPINPLPFLFGDIDEVTFQKLLAINKMDTQSLD